MRLTLLLLLALLAVGLALVNVESSPPAPAPAEAPWRYTVDGWERAVWLVATPPHSEPRIHPAYVAAAQLLSVLLALAFLSRTEAPQRPHPAPKPADGRKHRPPTVR